MNCHRMLRNCSLGIHSYMTLYIRSTCGLRVVSGCLSNRIVTVRQPTGGQLRRLATTCDPPYMLDDSSYERTIPKIKSEIDALKKRKFTPPSEPHFMSVSILGTPNAGKSTLTNILMGWRVCSVSKKVHTTKHNTKAVLVDGNKQIVFLDTPGLVSLADKRKHHLEWEMLTDPKSSLANTDLVIVLIDVSNLWTRHQIDPKILQLLEENKEKHFVLVMNKVDLVKSKKLLLDLTASLTVGVLNGKVSHAPATKAPITLSVEDIIKRTEKRLKREQEELAVGIPETPEKQEARVEEDTTTPVGWAHFKAVFMVSSLRNEGVTELRNYLLNVTGPGQWKHSPHFVTDQQPQEMAIMAVREKLLDTLPAEIPYNIKLVVEIWEVDEHGALRIVMQVNCPLKHHVKFVIGPQGQTVRQLALSARQELMNAFRCEVSLKLIVQHKE